MVVEGGKGTDTWDRRLEIYGEKDTIVIGLGTLRHKPYIKSFNSGKSEIFNVEDTGYTLHFEDIMAILYPGDKKTILTPETNEKIMRNSMGFIRKVYYGVCTEAEGRESYIEEVSSHENSFLNDNEKKIRKEMGEFLDNLL